MVDYSLLENRGYTPINEFGFSQSTEMVMNSNYVMKTFLDQWNKITKSFNIPTDISSI